MATSDAVDEPAGKGKLKLIILIVVAVLLAIGLSVGATWYFMHSPKSEAVPQADVNVSDQPRNWQGQQGQEQQARSGSGGQRLDSVMDDEPVDVAAVAPSVVLGSSAVDYYA